MVKNQPASARDIGSIPGSRRSPGGDGNPLQCSCLENPMDRAWRATVHGAQRVRHDLAHTHTVVLELTCVLGGLDSGV